MKCYLCGREGYTECIVCRQTLCKIHAEEEIGKSMDLIAICTSCKRKKSLKKIQTYTIICFIIMAVAIVIGVIITSRFLWY